MNLTSKLLLFAFILLISCSGDVKYDFLLLKKSLVDPITEIHFIERDSTIMLKKMSDRPLPLGFFRCRIQSEFDSPDSLFFEFVFIKEIEKISSVAELELTKSDLSKIYVQRGKKMGYYIDAATDQDSVNRVFAREWPRMIKPSRSILTFFNNLYSNKYFPNWHVKKGFPNCFHEVIRDNNYTVTSNNKYFWVTDSDFEYLKNAGLIGIGDTLLWKTNSTLHERKIKDWEKARAYFFK